MNEIELGEKKEDSFDAFEAYFAPDSGPIQYPTNENREFTQTLHRSAFAISFVDVFFIVSFTICFSIIIFCFIIFKTYYTIATAMAAILSLIAFCLTRNHSVEVTETRIKVFYLFISLYFKLTFSIGQ